jgi:hypothetical protein
MATTLPQVSLPGPVTPPSQVFRPSHSYTAYLGCAFDGVMNWADENDKLIAFTHIAPFVFAEGGQGVKALGALGVAGMVDLSGALKINRDCTEEVYGK